MPQMIGAIRSGFNTVTTHIYLILFPIGLDLLLWFGPHLRVKTLLTATLNDASAALSSYSTPDTQDMFKAAIDIWKLALEHFNLLSGLRSFPVGIPSLMAGLGPLSNPLGKPAQFESATLVGAFSTWLLISLVGLLAGTFYFQLLARIVTKDQRGNNLGRLGWEALQGLILVFIMLIILMIVGFPVTLFITLMAMISQGLAQVALVLVTLVVIWLLLPLVFSPHGIFTLQIDALRSTLLSYRLVRFFLPGTGLFLLIALVISQGMDTLWRVPPETSWMVLVGILGHAFISTSLVTASFTYYTSGIKWMEERMKKIAPSGVKI